MLNYAYVVLDKDTRTSTPLRGRREPWMRSRLAAILSGIALIGAGLLAAAPSADAATHHNPCARGQINVYYANPSNTMGSGKVHNSGHGAKLKYAIVHQNQETLTYAPLSGYKLRLVQVKLHNLSTNKVTTKKLSNSSRSYTNKVMNSQSNVEFFDLCASK